MGSCHLQRSRTLIVDKDEIQDAEDAEVNYDDADIDVGVAEVCHGGCPVGLWKSVSCVY